MTNSSRQEKLDCIRESGDDVYPRDFPAREMIKSVLFQFKSQQHAKETYLPNLKGNAKYKIAGRIMARRSHGNNVFFDLMDQTGTIQLHAKKNRIGEKKDPCLYPLNDGTRCCECDTCQAIPFLYCWPEIKDCDLGDMVGVEGTIGANPRGEPLFKITNWTLLAKALIEPADKFHGLKDPEQKYRHRERDLLSSPETRDLFRTRAEIVFEIRKYLNERDYVEIECPVLQPIYGGATARPFKTRHNALGQDFYLSISSELYLKRAMVGGFDRVYSFSRCFRNEGISPTHNPEFTNLEIFESCKTANGMREFTEKLIKRLIFLYDPTTTDGVMFDIDQNMLSSDWPLSRHYLNDQVDYPIADAWELFINDMEIASGASDLNDPREQESRLRQSELNANLTNPGNEKPEYDPYDKNYIEALECGALPWAGIGIGIDRLVMLLTGKINIRDTILFPTLRSEK